MPDPNNPGGGEVDPSEDAIEEGEQENVDPSEDEDAAPLNVDPSEGPR